MEQNITFSMKDIGPLIEEMVGQGDIFRLTVRGTSMMPFLRDQRDEVIFAPLEERAPKRGDILLFQRRGGTYVMHRLYRIKRDGTFTFIGDHQYRTEKGIQREQIKAYAPLNVYGRSKLAGEEAAAGTLENISSSGSPGYSA